MGHEPAADSGVKVGKVGKVGKVQHAEKFASKPGC